MKPRIIEELRGIASFFKSNVEVIIVISLGILLFVGVRTFQYTWTDRVTLINKINEEYWVSLGKTKLTTDQLSTLTKDALVRLVQATDLAGFAAEITILPHQIESGEFHRLNDRLIIWREGDKYYRAYDMRQFEQEIWVDDYTMAMTLADGQILLQRQLVHMYGADWEFNSADQMQKKFSSAITAELWKSQ